MRPNNRIYQSRSFEMAELMDQPCSYSEFRGCLRDLASVNYFTLAYRPTLGWLDRAITKFPTSQHPLRILDVGCGFGDMLRRIFYWSRRRGIPVRLTGIDINPHSTQAAREATPEEHDIHFITSDPFSYQGDEVDIIISSLLTHHLSNQDIVHFLSWMEEHTTMGWFINDLHRHPIPFYAFRLWAKIAAWHPFVQHDGPISILRSFTRSDWRHFCTKAGLSINTIDIRWHIPFRLCIHRLK
jgi:SAM-dependent methyltransferase